MFKIIFIKNKMNFATTFWKKDRKTFIYFYIILFSNLYSLKGGF